MKDALNMHLHLDWLSSVQKLISFLLMDIFVQWLPCDEKLQSGFIYCMSTLVSVEQIKIQSAKTTNIQLRWW